MLKSPQADGSGSKSILAALLETNQAQGGSSELEQTIKEVAATAYAGTNFLFHLMLNLIVPTDRRS
jgi:nucleoside permease NupC